MGMSTQPSSPFNDSLSWDFNAYDVGEEINLENEILTSLVRTSYLKHLQRSLSDNYGLWLEKNQDNDDLSEVGINDIVKCANFLEHKALRACMVTSVYQRAMVRTMKEIKRSTEEGSLYAPLIEQTFDNKCVKTKKVCDKEIQTNISLISYKTNECHQTTQEKEIQPSSLDISTENSNLIIINPRNDIVPDQENTDAIEDLFNILMHSPSFSDNSNFHSPKKRKIKEDSNFCNGQSNKLLQKSAHFSSLDTSISHFQSNLHYIKADPSEFNNTILSTDSVPSNISLLLNNSLEENCPLSLKSDVNVTIEKKSNLDERLKSLAALFGEDSHSPKEPIENNECTESFSDMSMSDENSIRNNSFSLPLDWRAEYAAQMCHLKMILSRMSSTKRHNVRRLFKELFGSDSSLHTYISNNEEALSRKRIANIVVSSLTPHYIGGKIASRDIFKALAKKITDEFLLLSYVAGHNEITKKVNSYFDNGKCINSIKDFHEFSYH